jgi:RHS repeat-associated protein
MDNPGSVISLPQGGGAVQGIGETFSPDLFTGTGNFTVPIALPPGRNKFQPQLSLQYSTGNGNDVFGLGWQLSIPSITRKTSNGVPRYQDTNDVFVLSGAEDLVPVSGDIPGGDFPAVVRYRPRTEGLFARIEFHRDQQNSFWLVRSKDGSISTYGNPNSFGNDPAAVCDPNNLEHVFAWKLTETRDSFGNRIRYQYERDEDAGQVYLSRIEYVDVPGPDPNRFLVSIDFVYENRPDPFSTHRAGFQLRTTRRCTRIEVRTHADVAQRVRTYQFVYLDQRDGAALPLNGVSLLSQIQAVGHNDSSLVEADRTQQLPPLEFGYSRFRPDRGDLIPLSGRDLPAQPLSASTLELVDLFGSGLPDLIEMNGTVRYWRNLGGGRFDLPRMMSEAPGLSLADAGVQLIDADGDGRTDLLVTKPELAGYYPLRFGGYWDQRSFQRYNVAPSFNLQNEDVRLVDLNGDGVTDVVRADNRLEFYFNDPHEGWGETRRVERRPLAEFPDVHFTDPRVHLADMCGDGLADIVMVHDGNVEYWPNLGHGNWGARVHMQNSPRLPFGYSPRQILIGDVDGDGVADLIFVDHDKIILWINQSGNAWSDPIEIEGTPTFTNEDDVRLVDLLGTGVTGVLWSNSPLSNRRERGFFLDLTAGVKPYLLDRMNNHRGAITEVTYRSSTEEYLRDQARRETRWKTTLPFPVQVVSKVVAIDEFSRGRSTTEYRYHHGYWDGAEREYRGFGCVEALNSETFESYYDPANASFDRVDEVHFSAPTLSRSWFHLGPVGDEFGDWEAVNFADEYWPDDPSFFTEEHNDLLEFLAGLERRPRRDALRALRGTTIRTELYAVDDTPRANRPYTVTELSHGLREIETPSSNRLRIFFPHLLAQRTTQWERGEDPLTQIEFKDDYDEYGQPRQSLNIACPRGWRPTENNSRPGSDYLTTFAESSFSQRDDEVYLVDRQASSTRFQIYPPQGAPAPAVTIHELRDQARNGSAPRQIISQAFNYFDGEAFTGLPLGQPGQFGALVRTETLITTEEILTAAYQSDDELQPTIPPYLDPTGEVSWPVEYPERFRQHMPSLAGYRFNPGDAQHTRGYFIDSAANRFDFQTPGSVTARGILTASRDSIGNETTTDHDEFALLPIRETNPSGLVTTAQIDYRVLQANMVTEPNGNRAAITFTALGLPQAIAVMGKEEEPAIGDTPEAPGTRFEYELLAYDNSPEDNRQPLSVRTIRRVHHVNDSDGAPLNERDDTIETVEYSDGFGRLLQTRAQAEDVLLGDEILGNDVLPADQTDVTATAALIQGRSRSETDPPNVVVSGWQTYDNKGNVVQKYEPFFDVGWDYLSLTEAEALREDGVRNLFGQRLQQFYDPRGQLIRTLNPDGSAQRLIYGVPVDLSEPDNFNPTPWEAYTYDANDLAPVTQAIDETPLTDRAPASHHFTPSSIELDALGRTVRSIQRNGPTPEERIITSSTYDIRGNVLTNDDALGRTAFRYVFDLANNQVRVVSIDAGIKRTVYNALGLIVEQRDSKDAVVLNTYDSLKRIVNTWSRDDSGQPVTLRQHLVYGDNAGEIGIDHATARSRNVLEKLVAQYDTAGRQRIISYDFKGNVLEKTRQVVSDDQILSVFAGAAGNNWQISAYQIDWDGISIEDRAAAILDPTEYTTSFVYDGLNRVIEVTLPQDVENERKLLQQSYNHAGALERISFAGDLYVERISYNAKGQRNLIAFGNGTMTRCAYDPHTFRLTRLRSERYTQPAAASYQPVGPTFQDIGYEYDLAGNLVTLRDRTPECGIPNTVQGTDALDRLFTYDAIYRLISATGRECNVLTQLPWSDGPRCTDLTNTRPYTEQYQYDANGNMLVLQHQNLPGGFTRQFSTPAENNRLEALMAGETEIAYSYDDAGNMVQETSSRHFEWDFVNRLKAFRVQTEGAEPSVFAHYLYDASGARVKKLVRRQGGQFTVTNYIDGGFEHHRSVTAGIEENNSVHVLAGTRRIAQRRIGQAFADDLSPAVQFEITDHLGSASVTVNDEGALINREEFTPYGETSFGSFARKRYRFTGKERDEESSLNYHGARYYAPWLGRWTATDPIGSMDGLNLYVYCQNSPCQLVDHQGMAAAPPEPEPEPGKQAPADADDDAPDTPDELDLSGTVYVFEDDTTVTPSGWAKLPKGPGLSPRKNKQQWGLTETIDALKVVAAEWERRHPGRVIWIGDISREGGGPLPPHKSHQRGIDVDVATVLHDPKKRGKFSFTNEAYSRELTQELITLFHTESTLPVEIIWFGDPDVEVRGPDEAPRTELSENDNNHRSHFHVRFEHPTEGRTSRRGGRRKAKTPEAKPEERSYTGVTGVEWVWPKVQPLIIDLPTPRF